VKGFLERRGILAVDHRVYVEVEGHRGVTELADAL
jgi:hypothetical protein